VAIPFESFPLNCPCRSMFPWIKGLGSIGLILSLCLTIIPGGSVHSQNEPPVINQRPDTMVNELQGLAFTVTASDAESATTLSSSPLPAGATFTAFPSSNSGSFNWPSLFVTPPGIYLITFYATDANSAVDSFLMRIFVLDAGSNDPPFLYPIGDQNGMEGSQLTINIRAVDGESIPALNISPLPTGASFVDSNNGRGLFTWLPLYTQSGNYSVVAVATDDSSATASELINISIVDGGNQLPLLAPIGSQSISEGQTLSFGISASDAEGSPPFLSTSALSTGSNFVNNGNGAGNFSWTPDYTQSGVYSVTFYATDDSSATDSEVVSITVADAGNQFPILDSVGNLALVEGDTLSVVITASDIESIPAISFNPIPTGAIFVDSGNGTALFTWAPTFTQSGNYPTVITTTDDSGAYVTEVISIFVADFGSSIGGLEASFSNFPNPFSPNDGVTTFAFFLNDAARVEIEIFTPMGSRAATIVENSRRAAGPNASDTWDGRNEAGKIVASGTYICRLSVTYDSGKTVEVLRKVALLR